MILKIAFAIFFLNCYCSEQKSPSASESGASQSSGSIQSGGASQTSGSSQSGGVSQTSGSSQSEGVSGQSGQKTEQASQKTEQAGQNTAVAGQKTDTTGKDGVKDTGTATKDLGAANQSKAVSSDPKNTVTSEQKKPEGTNNEQPTAKNTNSTQIPEQKGTLSPITEKKKENIDLDVLNKKSEPITSTEKGSVATPETIENTKPEKIAKLSSTGTLTTPNDYLDSDSDIYNEQNFDCTEEKEPEVKWGTIKQKGKKGVMNVKFWQIPSQEIKFKGPNRIQISNRKNREQKITPIETDLIEGNAFKNLFEMFGNERRRSRKKSFLDFVGSKKNESKNLELKFEGDDFAKKMVFKKDQNDGTETTKEIETNKDGEITKTIKSIKDSEKIKNKKLIGGFISQEGNRFKQYEKVIKDEDCGGEGSKKTFKVKIVGYNTDIDDGVQKNVMLVGKNKMGDEILIQQQVTEKVLDM